MGRLAIVASQDLPDRGVPPLCAALRCGDAARREGPSDRRKCGAVVAQRPDLRDDVVRDQPGSPSRPREDRALDLGLPQQQREVNLRPLRRSGRRRCSRMQARCKNTGRCFWRLPPEREECSRKPTGGKSPWTLPATFSVAVAIPRSVRGLPWPVREWFPYDGIRDDKAVERYEEITPQLSDADYRESAEAASRARALRSVRSSPTTCATRLASEASPI